MHTKILALVILLTLAFTTQAQTNIYAELGASYIEHFSTGIGIDINSNHKIGLLYGSNFFVNNSEFYTALVKYENMLGKLNIRYILPKVGCKAGYSVFTNQYYSWDLVVLAPYIGCDYSLNKKVDLFGSAGVAISRELSMKRVGMGEIGWYRRLLPEFKAGIAYKLF